VLSVVDISVLVEHAKKIRSSGIQIFSQFRDGLKEDLVLELWNHGVTNLKKAYALVQNLDAPS